MGGIRKINDWLLFVFVLFLSLAGWANEVIASDSKETRLSLKGLQGLNVLIEPDSNVEHGGLTRDQIQTDVELRLRKAGIEVRSVEESFKTPGYPYLYVAVTAVLSNTGIYGFNIDIELKQAVTLQRDPMITVVGSTWSTSVTGTVGKTKLKTVRESINDGVDKFINAYLAVNPKK